MKLKRPAKTSKKASQASSVVVGKAAGRTWSLSGAKRPSKRVALAAGLALIAVIIIVLVVVFAINHNSQTSGTVKRLPDTPKIAPNSSTATVSKKLANYYQEQISATRGQTQAQPYFQLAQVYFTQGDYNAALQAALKSNELGPDSLRTLETIGDTYAKLGQDKNAISYYQQDISVFKKSALAKQSGSGQTIQRYQNKINALKGGK